MESKIKIFETGKEVGIFSRNKKFYDERLTQEEMNEKFLNTRIKAGELYGFDGRKVIQAHQKSHISDVDYEDGKYIEITNNLPRVMDYWYLENDADFLIMKEDVKGVVIGNQMADCPVVIVEDRLQGVTALVHLGVSHINRYLVKQVIETLVKDYNSKTPNLYVYIGSCLGKNNYKYDRYPLWATNKEAWDGFIIEKDNLYYIDTVGAIKKQLIDSGITNIEISGKDTIDDPKFYSHVALHFGDESKKGQNFVGFYYK